MTTSHTASLPTRIQLGVETSASGDVPGAVELGKSLSRGLALILTQFRVAGTVDDGSAQSRICAEWRNDRTAMVLTAEFQDRTIKPGFLVTMTMPLLSRLTHAFYGGSGSAACGRTQCGAAEIRLFSSFAVKLAALTATTWPDSDAGAPALVQCKCDNDALTVFNADSPVVVQRFIVTCDGADSGAIEIVYPLAALHGRKAIAVSTSSPSDPVWKARLTAAVMEARLPLRTVIARPELPLDRVMSLAAGDVVPITLPAWVPLTVAGRKLAQGTIGDANGRAALKIHSFERERLDHG